MLAFTPIASTPLASETTGSHYALSGSTGAFALTGYSATLVPSAMYYTLSVTTGTFALTGDAAVLAYDRKLAEAAGTFVWTGSNATLHLQYTESETTGTYVLTGHTAPLAWDHRAQGPPGSFALTGAFTTLVYGTYLAGSSGSFVLSGHTAAFSEGLGTVVPSGTFALNGRTALFKWSRAPGAFTLSGSVSALAYNRHVTELAGAYNLSGTALGLRPSYSLAGSTGSFASTGHAATARAYWLLPELSTFFTLTGHAATELVNRQLNLSLGYYNLAGFSKLAYDRKVVGSLAFSISASALLARTYRLPETSGSFTRAGLGVARHNYKLVPQTGVFTVAARAAAFIRNEAAATFSTGAFYLSGKSTSLKVSRRITGTGQVQLYGESAALLYSGAIEFYDLDWYVMSMDAPAFEVWAED